MALFYPHYIDIFGIFCDAVPTRCVPLRQTQASQRSRMSIHCGQDLTPGPAGCGESDLLGKCSDSIPEPMNQHSELENHHLW